MVTSEFIIGHSADDAAERKGEPRKILIALLAALLIHLVVGYSIAVSGGLFASPAMVEEEKPIELSFVDLSTPKPTAELPEATLDESKQVAQAPKEKAFQANINAVAASQLPGTGDAPLPSQKGKERPIVNFETQDYSRATQGAQPQPSAAPVETPQPSLAQPPISQPTPTPEAEQLVMLTSTPTPAVQPSVTPRPISAYRPHEEKTRLSGSIINHGQSSLNAIGTPLLRYQKVLTDAIGSRWHLLFEHQGEMAGIGTLKLRFYVDRSGHVQNLKITENSSNETFANICLQSVAEAQFPPIPDDLADKLPPEGLEFEEISFTLYLSK